MYYPGTPSNYQDGGYSLCVEGYPWDMFAQGFPLMRMDLEPKKGQKFKLNGNLLYYPQIQATPGQSGGPIMIYP